jgi:hypothetical protein
LVLEKFNFSILPPLPSALDAGLSAFLQRGPVGWRVNFLLDDLVCEISMSHELSEAVHGFFIKQNIESRMEMN